MHITKRFDRAFQWAGEKMGGEARTSHTDEFRVLEAEMAMRHQGTDRLQKSMGLYVRWVGRRCDTLEDRERSSPIGLLGRTMAAHGEEYEPDSPFGNNLVAIGQANSRIATLQESYLDQANATWAGSLEQRAAMMKEYQAARKKLENRRLAYDASTAKLDKARRDDFRIEEEVRSNRTKFEETSEDVLQRMLDIKEAEADGVAALNEFLDAELEYHERCAEELRRAREMIANPTGNPMLLGAEPSSRSHPAQLAAQAAQGRSGSSRAWQDSYAGAPAALPEFEVAAPPPRSSRPSPPPPPQPARPTMARAVSDGRPIPRSAVAPPLPLTRVRTEGPYSRGEDVFADDASSASGSGSPDVGTQSLSPATSYGSLGRSVGAAKKVPPPVNRAKKPAPPPVPVRKGINLGY